MRISSLSLTNFRCFGPDTETIKLSDLTVLVGANGCGKSAALQALLRLFGTSGNERTLVREDFHLPAGKSWDEIKSVTLRIEVLLEFPELADEGDFDDAAAACFKHMTVREPGGRLYCRIRMDGTWEQSNLPDGDIDQKLWWVTSPLGTDAKSEKTTAFEKHDRSRIHVHYVPASRDPARQIRQVSGSLLHGLLRSVRWSEASRKEIEEASDAIREAFADEEGVTQVQTAIESCWNELHGAPHHRQVTLRPAARRLEDLLRHVEATFSPGPANTEDPVDRLSDGQRSLFYFALVAASLDVQEAVGYSDDEAAAISREQLKPPVLNVLAVEEPENSVAPHYLGRIMTVLRRIASSERGQTVLTSHCASILARANPEEVRHLRSRMPCRTTLVRAITLPEEASEQHAFVRQAVRAYPELYFAKYVVLGEGDSEEIVLPRLAEVSGVPIDSSFVSVVPLGGRHVNHFWRLLEQLEIPYATLLDLDRERHGGGWGRIKYALEQLLKLGRPSADVLAAPDGTALSRKDLGKMHTWDVSDVETMQEWIVSLERWGVFFSQPLDLDFMMLRAFPDAYQATAEEEGGPSIPDEDDPKYENARRAAVRAVLKSSGSDGETYDEAELNEFFWYRYLFLGRSKPSTHILALTEVSRKDLRRLAPKVLRRLVERLKDALEAAESEDGDGE